MLRETLTVCGLPTTELPPSLALSVIVALYAPLASALDVIVAVKVAWPPLLTETGVGEIANHPLLPASTVAVIVTLPEQPPETFSVKLCAGVVGLLPWLAENVSTAIEGVESAQGAARTVKVTVSCTLPADRPVVASSAVIVTVPL